MAFYVSIAGEKAQATITTSNKSALVTGAISSSAVAIAALPGVGVPVAIGVLVAGGLAAGVSSLFVKEQTVPVGEVLRAATTQALQSGVGYGYFAGAPGVPFAAKYIDDNAAVKLVAIPAGALLDAIFQAAPPKFTQSIANLINALDTLVITSAPGLGGTYPVLGFAGSLLDIAPPPPIGGGTTGEPTGGGNPPTGGGAESPNLAGVLTLLSLISLFRE